MRKLRAALVLSAACLFGASAAAAQAATTPPTATIVSPPSGGTYAQGQSVTTSFNCVDPAGSGIASCKDSNGVSSPTGHLDTSSAGQHTYTVTAVANDGLTAATSIAYAVVDCSTQSAAGYNDGFQSGFQAEFRAAYRPNGGWQLGFRSGLKAAHRKLVGGYTVREPARVAGHDSAASRAARPAATTPPSPCDQAFNTSFNVGFNRGFNAAFNSAFDNGYQDGLKAKGR